MDPQNLVCQTIEQLPGKWETFAEGNQLVAHGADGEEIIVTKFAITGDSGREGSSIELTKDQIRKLILENAANPNLAMKGECEEKEYTSGFCALRLSSISLDNEILFDQFAICGSTSVYITYECPITAESGLSLFAERLNGSIRDASGRTG